MRSLQHSESWDTIPLLSPRLVWRVVAMHRWLLSGTMPCHACLSAYPPARRSHLQIIPACPIYFRLYALPVPSLELRTISVLKLGHQDLAHDHLPTQQPPHTRSWCRISCHGDFLTIFPRHKDTQGWPASRSVHAFKLTYGDGGAANPTSADMALRAVHLVHIQLLSVLV